MAKLKRFWIVMLVIAYWSALMILEIFFLTERESFLTSKHNRNVFRNGLTVNIQNLTGMSDSKLTRTHSYYTDKIRIYDGYRGQPYSGEKFNSTEIRVNKSNEISSTNYIPGDIMVESIKDNPGVLYEALREIHDENNEFDITVLDEHIEPILHQRNKNADSLQDKVAKRLRLKWDGDYSKKLNASESYRQDVYNTFYRKSSRVQGINCNAVIRHDDFEIAKAKRIMLEIPRRAYPVEKYARIKHCEGFRAGRGYIEHPLSQIELDFPLAFGIIVYREVELAERLLRSIYRPHNFYCFHLDIKMKDVERAAMENIARCLDNVYISNISINVTWGEFSVLQADLLCMETLLRYKQWKYYINLTGQEFPLKTNKEIVSILKSLQGANVVDGSLIRARQKYFYRWTEAGHLPPHRIRPIKGSVHVGVNRQFVDFALNDYRAIDFLEWLKKTKIPDETFYASLNHNSHLGINGSFLGEPEEYALKPSIMRYKNWELGHGVFVRNCEGKFVRHVCVLGVGDLHQAYNDIGLFVNKFNLDFQHVALDCLEKILNEKTWTQYLNDERIDTSYFESLDYVRQKLFVPPVKNQSAFSEYTINQRFEITDPVPPVL